MCSICAINVSVFILLVTCAEIAFSNQLYGNCSASAVHSGELLWQFKVHRTPNMMPYQTAEAAYGSARATINCVNVTSIGEDGGITRITSGGVGSNHANFTFSTSRGKPIHVRILIYGIVN